MLVFFSTPTRAWVVAADLDRPYWLRRVQRFLQIRNILGVREANDVVPSMLCTNVGDVPTALFASYANDDGLFFASELGHCLPAFRTPDRHRRTPRSLPRHRTKASRIRRFVELNSCRGVWLGSPTCSKQRIGSAIDRADCCDARHGPCADLPTFHASPGPTQRLRRSRWPTRPHLFPRWQRNLRRTHLSRLRRVLSTSVLPHYACQPDRDSRSAATTAAKLVPLFRRVSCRTRSLRSAPLRLTVKPRNFRFMAPNDRAPALSAGRHTSYAAKVDLP